MNLYQSIASSEARGLINFGQHTTSSVGRSLRDPGKTQTSSEARTLGIFINKPPRAKREA